MSTYRACPSGREERYFRASFIIDLNGIKIGEEGHKINFSAY
jgi:hypothetical protein